MPSSINPQMAGYAMAKWVPVMPTLSSSFPGGGVFTQSEVGIPVVGGETLLLSAVGGGGGGGGGGSTGGGATPNASGGGGGGHGVNVEVVTIVAPVNATTLDITIGAGGNGGAIGSPGTAGGNTVLQFRDAAGAAIDGHGTLTIGAGRNGLAGGSAAGGVASTGGAGGDSGSFLNSGPAGTSGAAGANAPSPFILQIGWGILRTGTGAAGGGVSAANAGFAGGSHFGQANLFGMSTSSGGAGAGALGGGGSGGRSPFLAQGPVQISGGAGGVAGANANTAWTGGIPFYGSGGGGGGGNAAGGNGAQGAVRLLRQV